MYAIFGVLKNLSDNSDFVDKETGLVKTTFQPQFEFKYRNKFSLDEVKIPAEFRPQWEKFVGQFVILPMKKWQKGDASGVTLYDAKNPVPELLPDFFKADKK